MAYIMLEEEGNAHGAIYTDETFYGPYPSRAAARKKLKERKWEHARQGIWKRLSNAELQAKILERKPRGAEAQSGNDFR